MANIGLVERGDVLAGEGQVWLITENGILEYGSKNVVESPLEQNEKTVVETVEAAPIVEESALEQIVNDPILELTGFQCDPSKYVEKFGANSVTEIEDFETRAPFSNDEIESFEIPKQAKVNTDNFKVWQIIDDMGSQFIELLSQSKAKPIENIDYKIATLNLLADTDIYNPKISATLREIVADLRN